MSVEFSIFSYISADPSGCAVEGVGLKLQIAGIAGWNPAVGMALHPLGLLCVL